MFHGHRVPFLALSLIAGAATSAYGQDIQTLRPAEGPWNYFSVQGARIQREGEIIPTLAVSFGQKPLIAVIKNAEHQKLIPNGAERGIKAGDEISVVENLGTADLIVTYAYSDTTSFTLDVPLSYVSGQVVDYYNELNDKGKIALGDIRGTVKFRLHGLDDYKLSRGFGVATSFTLSIPTGSRDHWLSESLNLRALLMGEYRSDWGGFALNGGFKLRSQRYDLESISFRNEFIYGGAGEVYLYGRALSLIGELYGSLPVQDFDSDASIYPLEALLGTRYIMGFGPVFTLAGGTPIISDAGAAQWRVLFSFSWHNQNYDSDNDGVLDEFDLCPDEPEDHDGFEDEDGCPDPDNDQDGILDIYDRCPDEREDKDGFEDEDGCPDIDNDQDGILDVNDRCPNQPETFNGYQDEDGCPDTLPDIDGDGIPDREDKCPEEPETYNGFQDEDGCPDKRPY